MVLQLHLTKGWVTSALFLTYFVEGVKFAHRSPQHGALSGAHGSFRVGGGGREQWLLLGNLLNWLTPIYMLFLATEISLGHLYATE